MKHFLTFGRAALVPAVAFVGLAASAITPLYLDDSQPIDARVEDALSRMTVAEKVRILHAQSKFSSAGVPRLGIPDLWTSDGPHGIRPEVLWDEWDQAGQSNDSCMAFPALTALAATWNPEMSLLYGRSIGEEARYREKDVLLGPGVNIFRTPLNGRNFEYMGEDPWLASQMVVPYVKGVQSNGVAACVKHFALNNHETHRIETNVSVDDRTLYEIYLPAFRAAVKEGDAWSIMGAYNLYNNQHLCHNRRLLVDVLKGEWDFDGAVISDWGGCLDTDEAITNGLDLEFGSWTDGLKDGKADAYSYYYLATPYLERLADGRADMATLDDKVRRVLRLNFRTAMNRNKPFGAMDSEAHYDAARRIGDEGIVLLKNDRVKAIKGAAKPKKDERVLPLPADHPLKVLVVGENAIKMMTVGGGSSSLKVQREILPVDGLRAALPAGSTVEYQRGYVGDMQTSYNNVNTGQDLTDSRTPEQLIADAVAAARNADYVVFFGGLNKSEGQDSEGSDRSGLELPYGQDAVIEALAEVNPRLVVVNISGNPVAMPWVNKVPAIVQGWFLGSEAGNSIADILTGRVNPSGRLPMTFPVKLDDVAAHNHRAYPGTKRGDENIWDVTYEEGILTGYRWHDARGIKPLFPFGHGLSYTSFAYGRPTLSSAELKSSVTASLNPEDLAAATPITVTVPVTNTGDVAGSETVQLYLSDNAPVDAQGKPLVRAPKELKGFQKIALAPGETGTVTFTITPDQLAWFDASAHKWTVHPGEYTAHIAASAGDVRHSVKFSIK